MTPQLIITQIVIVLIGIYLAFTENKKNIYLVTFLFNLSTMIMYIFNHDKAATISSMVLTIRALVYIMRDRLKTLLGRFAWTVPCSFFVLHLVLGLISIDSPIQLLCIAAPILTAAYMWWEHGTQDLRAGNSIAYGLWALYEGITGLYIVMVSDIVQTLVFAYSFIAHRRRNAAE